MAEPPFDPSRHMTRVDGREYLPVKARIAWLRDEYPDSHIETDLHSHHGDEAVFRCRITRISPTGTEVGKATGWGSETKGDHRDYLEKAETKSIGRALAALGYGTQFVDDHDETPGQPVDSPGRAPQGSVRALNGNAGQAQGQYQQRQPADPNEPITPNQLKFVWDLLRQAGYEPHTAEARVLMDYDVQGGPEGLSKRQAMGFIKTLKQELGLPD